MIHVYQQLELTLYSLDPSKLLKAVGRDHAKFMVIRWCLDYLFAVKKSHICTISEMRKSWPFDTSLLSHETLKAAPEYITILAGRLDGEDDAIHSRVLKQYFEQIRIMKLLGEGMNAEDISLSNKRTAKEFGQEIEVFKDNNGKCLEEYCGLFPTRSYEATNEVFCISGAFFNYLTAKYPDIDVSEKLSLAHKYLVSTPVSRRHHASMKRYLEAWISGDLLMLNKMKKKKPQINKHDFYESLRNE